MAHFVPVGPGFAPRQSRTISRTIAGSVPPPPPAFDSIEHTLRTSTRPFGIECGCRRGASPFYPLIAANRFAIMEVLECHSVSLDRLESRPIRFKNTLQLESLPALMGCVHYVSPPASERRLSLLSDSVARRPRPLLLNLIP